MEMMDSRIVYGRALAEIAESNEKIVALTADVGLAVRTDFFSDKFPDRFFNCGVQEAAMVDVAVGLSLGGMIPFANTFATLFLRAYEQIRSSVAYPRLNVKIIAGYGGISDFKDGATHHAVEDVAAMRALPNMLVLVPSDYIEMKKFIPLIADYKGPVYLRVSRAEIPRVFDDDYSPAIGKGTVLREGRDVTIFANSIMLYRSLEAAKQLEKDKIESTVVSMHTVKPIDKDIIAWAAKTTGAIVTAEEHSIIGGLGGAVSEVLSNTDPVPIEYVGIRDTFTQSAVGYDELLDHYGLGIEDVVKSVHQVLDRKKKQ